MEKILKPKENYNPEKLCKEIKNKEIENRIWDLEASYKLEWEEGAEAVVQSVLDAHDPTPEPEPLTDLQQTQLAVAEAVEKQEADKIELQLALAEFIESTMGGGE